MPVSGEVVRNLEQKIIDANKIRKGDKILKQNDNEAEILEVKARIKQEYPNGISEERFKKYFTKIVPLKCNNCKIYKILPYDFISDNCKQMNAINCKTCVPILSKTSKRCKDEKNTICECGLTYYGSEDNTYKHLASESHNKRVKMMINDKYYKQNELIVLAKQYKIPYYKTLSNYELIDLLKNFM